MFVIRRAKVDDVPTLLKLARMVHFINLPPDRDIITQKVTWSRNCFLLAADEEAGVVARAPARPERSRSGGGGGGEGGSAEHGALAAGIRGITGKSPFFMFVLEEIETGGVIGTSQIIAKMGGPGQPNVSLQLSRREMFSKSLQMGVTHTVARLHLDESGPTEVGGLILQPSFRGHRQKLGRLVALVRFHFMGLHRHLFSDRVLAEMMGPISVDGENPFWDYCTRCFINLTYDQADRFCQQSKEFILTLFPREDIYLTLLAPEARSVVGQVGEETVPARRMLEGLGFKYFDRIDPFDGGPHLESPMDQISIVKETFRARLAEPARQSDAAVLKRFGIVSTLDSDGEFRAIQTAFDLDRSGRVVLSRESLNLLQSKVGVEAGVTPIPNPDRALRAAAAAAGAARNGKHAVKPAKKKSAAKGSKQAKG
ncbi:MAG: arginine N-succinyltransferase [Phycisphaerales bacterium]